jgi:Peptidase family S41/Tricorn protease C1 domain
MRISAVLMRSCAALAAATIAATAVVAPAYAVQTARLPTVDSVWQTDGYGLVLAIDDGRLQTYQTTAISCLPGFALTQAGPPDRHGAVRFEDEDGIGYTVTPVRTGARLRVEYSVGYQSLHAAKRVPARCERPAPTGPVAAFDVFWQTYAENYPFFAARGVDWNAVRATYRPRVNAQTTDDELFAILTDMIRPLNDAHTEIRAGERRYQGVRPGTTIPIVEQNARVEDFIKRRDLAGLEYQTWANGLLGYADLPDGLGYLRVVTFASYADEPGFAAQVAELDRALDAILTPERTSGPDRLRGLVVDLRINGGGSDVLGLRLASRLTDRPFFAYAKQARNHPTDPDEFTTPQPTWVRPAAGKTHYTGPIVMLTGGSTLSAGESFTQAMMQRSPRPVRIGEHTQGIFSDVLIRQLPNGWLFGLPNEEFLTRDGRTFDGVGIPPDIQTPVFTEEEFAQNRDSAFDAAISLLKSGKS